MSKAYGFIEITGVVAAKSRRQAGMLFTEIQMEYKCQMEILCIQYMWK